ncbi:Ig-like domain-containing domain [Paraflavitalea sp. CAU 1676]|uniref:Ig-like domain-containing domain n=1 Tax=Paraflavitalea sp. CAU 1676 TaxID=3032598 RepID=UPI0023D9D96E|nr:Ig-like domain-containing domain [Paraflavitalea sp. CAU 1676]MDF2190700.1 Ig-like domain-containing domain [Paraflavitalea sp. CAU 1676]
MKQVLSILFILVVIAQFQVITVGCANIIAPMGGPKDSLPPQLMEVRPADSTRHFTGKRIVFEFDEFIAAPDNIQENLLISPLPKLNPVVTSKLKTLTVVIKDTLEDNTTYSINFGSAIKDINEGNILKDFTYIFTTGSTVDSLTVSGKVIVAETGKPDSTLIAALHKKTDDSAVVKERPRYITKLDKEGQFTFHNLPPGTFALYVFKDEGGQRKFMNRGQLFAFADSLVNTTEKKSFTLYAYPQQEKEEKKKDTAKPKAPVVKPATNKGAGVGQDKRLRLETNLANQELDILGQLEISFKAAPLKSFDSTKVQFVSEKFEPLSGYRYITDSSNKKITLQYAWVPNTAYNLIVDKDFAEDSLGHKLTRTDTLQFRTKKEADYGLVRLRFPNLDLSKNPVLQFVQGDQVKFSHPFTNNTFNAKLFIPGEYDLRILFDTNKNGIWDPGDFFGKHLQPERVMPISRKLTIKANWDNEIDITL